MAKRAGTTRLAKRAVPDGPACRCAAQARPGGTMAHLSILYNLAKKCVFVGTQTHNPVHKRLKHIHLTSAATILLCYMLNSYT
jgi:hypothetical protein